MKIHGLDFTSSPRNGKSFVCITGKFIKTDRFFIGETRPFLDFVDFEKFLKSKGPWLAGLDLPFGLPREFLLESRLPPSWPKYVAQIGKWGRARFETTVKNFKSKRRTGYKEPTRITDSLHGAQSPIKTVNAPLAAMFYEGATRILKSGVSVHPCHPKKKINRAVLETYPVALARWFHAGPYKVAHGGTVSDKLRDARVKIMTDLSSASTAEHLGFFVEITSDIFTQAVEDGGGDTLDSLLCAVQAAWAYRQKWPYGNIPVHPVVQTEGWIVCPDRPLATMATNQAGRRSFNNVEKLMDQIRQLSAISRSLSSEPNVDVLTEMIVQQAEDFTHADGGTLYIVDKNALHFKVVRNKTLNIRMGGTSGVPITFPPVEMRESNVSAYAAMTGNLVNIPDVYDYKPFDFTGPKKFDAAMNYRTQSMLVVPMRGPSNKVIGVLQLLNAKDPDRPSKTVPFAQDFESLIESLASQAAVAITNAQLMAEAHQANAELALTRDQAMEANRAKSRFLATMSHELRTPMNAIIGYSEMLQEEAEESHLKEFVNDLQKISTSGKYLLGLINDILDLSKIEAGKMEVHLDAFDINNMINDVRHTIHPLIAKNNNTMEVHCPEHLGPMFADHTRVRQMLINLLSNACKFTHTGTIRLTVSREIINDADWLNFKISDTGIGIAEDKIKHLFIEFSQAEPTTFQKYGGSGLGLAISRRFCRMMGGDITVTSELGKGSVFTIRLPARVTAAFTHPLRRVSDSGMPR
jgi:signal transduction histidine kinase